MIKMISVTHSPSGICLYSRLFDDFCQELNEKKSFDLISSFLSAMRLLSHEFGQDEIKLIEMSSIKFLIAEKEEILLFFLLDSDDEIRDFRKKLLICANAFLKMYSPSYKTQYNNISNYEDYDSVLEEILKISPDKIEKSCISCPMGQKSNCILKKVQEKIIALAKN